MCHRLRTDFINKLLDEDCVKSMYISTGKLYLILFKDKMNDNLYIYEELYVRETGPLGNTFYKYIESFIVDITNNAKYINLDDFLSYTGKNYKGYYLCKIAQKIVIPGILKTKYSVYDILSKNIQIVTHQDFVCIFRTNIDENMSVIIANDKLLKCHDADEFMDKYPHLFYINAKSARF